MSRLILFPNKDFFNQSSKDSFKSHPQDIASLSFVKSLVCFLWPIPVPTSPGPNSFRLSLQKWCQKPRPFGPLTFTKHILKATAQQIGSWTPNSADLLND